jgi:dGTPase
MPMVFSTWVKDREGGLRISYATLGAFMKYPKRVYLKPTKKSLIKKYGFQTDKAFEEVAQDGFDSNKSG